MSLRRGAAPLPAGYTLVRVDRRRGGVLGNPYVLQREADRAMVLARHRALLAADLARRGRRSRALEALAARLRAGEALALGCWCAPRPCHGDDLRAALLDLVRRRVAP